MKSVSRLVQAFTPAHYTLSTTINRPGRTFSGVVTIEGEALADSNEIRLHAKDLTIHSALIDGKATTTRLEPHDELVLEQSGIAAGKHIIVVEYAGIITDSMNGIYPGYFEVNGEKQELIGTQFESHYARQAFPVIDEPEAKATFDITLTTEKNVTVLSNMPVAQQTEQDEIAEQQLRAFVARVVTPLYEKLGWEARPNETENDTKLRGLAISLALYGEIPDALANATNFYETTPVNALNSELRAQILGNAVRSTSDQTVVDALIAEYKKATHSELRDDIAAALTSTKDGETVKKLAALSKDSSTVRPQDFTHWFVWLLRNRHGREYMWQWAQDEWPWLKKTFSGDSSYDMFPRYIASSLVTAAQAREFAAFFQPLKEEVALRRNITIGATELSGRVELIEREGPKVRQALAEL